MKVGTSVSCRGMPGRFWPGLLLSLLAGCATAQPHIEQALKADSRPTGTSAGAVESYHARCPDVLEVTVDGRPDLSGRKEIGPDGRIDLGSPGRARVEGLSAPDIARRVAEESEVAPAGVHVRVATYKSEQIFLIGQVAGSQSVVPYQGPETVVDLLRRVGGLTPGAAPDDVYVVRSRMVEGRRPEVFRVDLRAIVLRNDQRTNVTIQPLDQVFVGESGRCSFEKCIPPWLRPLYEAFCGMRHPATDQDAQTGQSGQLRKT